METKEVIQTSDVSGPSKLNLSAVAVAGFGNGAVEEISHGACHQHDDAHHEDPHQQLHLDGRVFHGQQDEGDQRDAGNAVSLEAVGGGAHGIARVVTRAVGDHAGVARVVLFDLEDDLHEVGTDVGNLGEDAAGDAEGRRTEGFADSEPDEAGPGIFAGDKEEDDEHHQKLDADQHHADAHAGPKGNLENGIGLAAKAGKCRAGIGERVDANAEPRHAVTAGDPYQTEEEDNPHSEGRISQQHLEIDQDDGSNENPEQQQEFSLRNEIGLAGLPNQLGDICHRAVNGQVLQACINDQSKEQAEDAKERCRS